MAEGKIAQQRREAPPPTVVRLLGLMLGILVLGAAQAWAQSLAAFAPAALVGATMALTAIVGDAAAFLPVGALARWSNRLTFGPGEAARSLDEMVGRRML